MDRHLTYIGQTLDRYWTDTGQVWDRHLTEIGQTLDRHWTDTGYPRIQKTNNVWSSELKQREVKTTIGEKFFITECKTVNRF